MSHSVEALLEKPLPELSEQGPGIGKGTKQVVLREPGQLDPRKLRGVRELIACVPFSCREPLPDVHGLYLSYGAEIDQWTARQFSGLNTLRVESKEPVSLSWFETSALERMSIDDRSVRRWSEIEDLPLRYLRLLWGGVNDLGRLPSSLESVSIGAWPQVRPAAFASVWALPGVKSIAVHNFTFKDLRASAAALKLSNLTISTRALKGVETFRDLTTLRVTSVNSALSLAPLAASGALRSLEIYAAQAPQDLPMLGRLEKLERLILALGTLGKVVDVDSLQFLSSMKGLRELDVHTVHVRDDDVRALQELPSLKILKLAGRFGPAVRQLVTQRRRKPRWATDVNIVAPAMPERSPLVPSRIRGAWTIFGDLRRIVGGQSNYSVEGRVKKALRKKEPTLLKRIEFDSERDAFSARTVSKSDIDVVARTIAEMSVEA